MSNTVVVRYRTKPDQTEVNHSLVAAVFAELAETDPGGVRYGTLRLADNTFVHIAHIEADPNPLAATAAFAEFQREIADRCEPGEGPEAHPATLVGEYRLFTEGLAG